jgi:hypothetical protein
MADLTASTALRDFIAGRLSSTGGCYMWATLHSANTALTAGAVYATTGLDELSTANGYTAQGKTCGTITQTNGTLDTPDVVWTTGAGETLTATHCAIWIKGANSIVGASLVCVKESTQTATNTGTLTATMTNTIVIPTPA